VASSLLDAGIKVSARDMQIKPGKGVTASHPTCFLGLYAGGEIVAEGLKYLSGLPWSACKVAHWHALLIVLVEATSSGYNPRWKS
jgi:hypothetical protein